MLKKKLSLQITGLLFVVAFGSCQNPRPFNKNNEQAFVKTDTAKAVLTEFYEKSTGYGSIQAMNSLDLEAKFDGIVHFESLNGRINKGRLIYSLGGREIALQKENLNKALAQAQTAYNYSKQVYTAQKLLIKKKFLSKIDFEKVSLDFENAQSNLNKARYHLKYFLTMTSYKAPFDGYLDNIRVAQGEDAVTGQLLATFQNDDHIKLVANFYGNLHDLKSDTLLFQVDGENYQGKLIYWENAVNPESGGHTIWIALHDPNHQLKSGTYVTYVFLSHPHFSVAVPQASLIQKRSTYYVISLQDGKYQQIAVQPGQEKNGLVEIKSGLKAGIVVLTKGAFEVFYGNLTKSMKVAD